MSFWDTAFPTPIQQAVNRLGSYLHYEGDDHWDHTKTADGAILSIRWPASRYKTRFDERHSRPDPVQDPC